MAVQTDTSTTPNTEVTFPVTGMTCASCVRRIEKALNRVVGVQDASVNLATERARVVYDPSMATQTQMRAAIEKAGYRVGELPETAPVAASSTLEGSLVQTPAPAADAHDPERQRAISSASGPSASSRAWP